MNQFLHSCLPGRALAAERSTLSGRVEASELAPRLAEAVARSEPAGTVSYELSFAPGPDEAVAVTGWLQASLEATCQRCLQPFVLHLEVPVEVLLEARAAAQQADSGTTWDAVETAPSLGELIEEELLLALPFLPRHAPQECAASDDLAALAAESREETQRPFAGLREALDAANRRD
ncbi:MAG: YceD family protein [Gammaproteobacteria bacterium]